MTQLHLYKALHGPRCHPKDDEYHSLEWWEDECRYLNWVAALCLAAALGMILVG